MLNDSVAQWREVAAKFGATTPYVPNLSVQWGQRARRPRLPYSCPQLGQLLCARAPHGRSAAARRPVAALRAE
jgi:hypothetical protein